VSPDGIFAESVRLFAVCKSAMNMMYLPVAEGIDLSNPNSSLHLGYNDAHKAYNAKIKGRRPKMSLKIFKIFTVFLTLF